VYFLGDPEPFPGDPLAHRLRLLAITRFPLQPRVRSGTDIRVRQIA